MAVYAIIFSLTSFLAIFETYIKGTDTDPFYIDRQRKVINICLILVLILISGTRLIGGTDYMWYENAYNSVPTLARFFGEPAILTTNFWLRTLDKGYLFITSVFKTMGLNFHQYCLVESAFFYFCLYKGLSRYCDNFSVVLLAFLTKLFFYNTFISMRQSLTVAIFFLCLPLIEERKIVKYGIVCCICLMIHGGSIILFAAYFLSYLRASKEAFLKWIIAFSPFAVFEMLGFNIWQIIAIPLQMIFGLISPMWGQKVTAYLSAGGEGISSFYILEFLLIAALLYMKYNAVIDLDERTTLIIKVFMCLWPILTVFGGFSIITREKDYFIMSYGIIMCYVIVSSKKKEAYIWLAGMIAICAFEFFRYIILFDNGGFIPYQSWLF